MTEKPANKLTNSKTVVGLLSMLIESNNNVAEEVKTMHNDIKDLIGILIEKERPVNVEVKTSTAEELKEALKVLEPKKELIRRAR